MILTLICFATFKLMETMLNIHYFVHIDVKTEFEKDVECWCLSKMWSWAPHYTFCL